MESWEKNVSGDLDIPIKSFRISALEEIIRSGDSEDVLHILEEREPKEDDEECRLLFSHAILAVKRRLGLLSQDAEVLEEKAFLKKYEIATAAEKTDLLAGLSLEKASAFSRFAPGFLEKETNPLVIATLIRIFGMVWPRERINDFAAQLRSDSLSVRLATLNVLIHRAPKNLEKSLPKLLLSSDPRIRALAIRGLSQLDPDEAVAHLDSLFSSPERAHKLAAIQNAFFFQFVQVKNILLKFLAAESDPELLERAGLLLAINLDVEVPYRLWEIAENSEPVKREAVRKTWDEVLSLIEKSRVLGAGFPEYRARLGEWISQRAAVRLVQETIAILTEADGFDPEFEATLKMRLDQPGVRLAFQEALGWSISARAREKINALLTPPAAPAALQVPEQAGPFDSLAPEQKIRMVSSWVLEDLKDVRGRIEEIVTGRESEPDLRAAAIRSAIRLGIGTLSPRCEEYLGHANASLASAALEYLGHFNADRIFPLLGKYLQSPNLRMQKTALRILKKFDSAQSIATIKTLLGSRNPVQQEMAMPLMIYFDFSLVRALLFSFLETTTDFKLFEAGLCFFQANPDPENLYLLFRLEKKTKPEFAEKVREIRMQSGTILQRLGRLDPAKSKTLDRDFEARWKKEEEKKKAPLAPYSVKKLYPQGSLPAGEPFLEKLFSGIAANLKPLLISAAVAAIIAVGVVSLRPERDDLPIQRVTKEQLPFSITVKGTILEADPKGESATLAVDGRTIFLIAKKKEFLKLPPKATIKAVFIPHRAKRDGMTVGTLMSHEIQGGK